MTSPELTHELYETLRAKARRLAARGHGAVAATSLVHEVLLKLWRSQSDQWADEAHFRATAGRAMRQVLVDRARARGAAKRGGGLERVTLAGLGRESTTVDSVALHQALARLEQADPVSAEVVTLRLLGGLEVDDVAELLSMSASTVKRRWRAGRAFMATALGETG